MPEKAKEPAIRFKGYTDAWEQRKLGELMMIIGGNAWKSEDYSDTGNYLVVTIANVNGRYFIDDSFGNRIDVDNPGVYLLRKNDILISLTGNVGRVSKMTEIPAVLNQRVAKVVVDRANIDNEFIYQILSSFRFENAMIKAGQGAAQSNISNSNVKEYSAFMPNSRSEQAEIGAVFKHLDNLITLHQRKLLKLKNIKKAMLEKMFPQKGSNVPEIRFSGFTDAWEQRKLKDIADYKNGTGHEDQQSDTGKYELVNLNSISIEGGLKPSGRHINNAKETLEINDLVMVLSDVGHGDLLGRVAMIPENNRFVLNQRVALLKIKDNTNPYYLFSYINANQSYFKMQGAGSSQLNISKESVENFGVLSPSRDEQNKIADYFQNLDNLITLHQRKYEKLQNLKKACLEKMFV